MDRRTFIFSLDWWEAIRDCPAEVRLEVYDSIMRYAESGTLSELKPMACMAMNFIRQEMDRNARKYEDETERRKAISEKRRMAGEKGAEATNSAKSGKIRQNPAKVGKSRQTTANADIYVYDSVDVYEGDSVSESDNEKEIHSPKGEVDEEGPPPPPEEILRKFLEENRGHVDQLMLGVEDYYRLGKKVLGQWELSGWKRSLIKPGAGDFEALKFVRWLKKEKQIENERNDKDNRREYAGRGQQGAPSLAEIAGEVLRRNHGRGDIGP